MREYAEVALALAAVIGAPADGATESSLVPTEGTLDVPPLAEHPLVPAALRSRAEPLGHLAPVLARRCGGTPARVDRDHRGADAKVFTRELVMSFGVECRVGRHPVPSQTQRRQKQNGRELRGIVGRAFGDPGPGDEVGMCVGCDREFGPTAGCVFALGPRDEVSGGVAAIEAGGIDGDGRLFGDQFRLDGGCNGALEEVEEDPPFNSRPSA